MLQAHLEPAAKPVEKIIYEVIRLPGSGSGGSPDRPHTLVLPNSLWLVTCCPQQPPLQGAENHYLDSLMLLAHPPN